MKNIIIIKLSLLILSLVLTSHMTPYVTSLSIENEPIVRNTAVFEKLNKGVNQDASMIYNGTFEKVVHEREHMRAIKEAGFESVRIFIPYRADIGQFEQRIQDALDYDLAIVVCMWGKYSEWQKNIEQGEQEIASKWEEMAEAWKDYPNDLVFEILNEPKGLKFADNDADHTKAMRLYNAAIPAIRAIDPDRPILVGSPGYNDSNKLDPYVTLEHLNYTLEDGSGFFDDLNMGVSIHFYEPNHSSGTNFAMWTATLPNDDSWKKFVIDEIDLAVEWREKYETDMPIVVTEWGCWLYESRTNGEDLPKWLDLHMSLFEEHNIGSMWYTGVQNNQRAFGIFNSETGWNQVVLDYLTGVKSTVIPPTSQIIDSEFVSWGSNTWKLTSSNNVTKGFVNGAQALSGSNSVKLTISEPTDSQMYQRTLIGDEVNENIEEGRSLLHLLKGETYTISFMAKAINEEGLIKVRLRKNVSGSPSDTYFESEDIVITTTKETYTLTYTHEEETEMDVWFAFDIGLKAQEIVLDKVTLTRNGDIVLEDNEVPPTSINDNLKNKELIVYPNPASGSITVSNILDSSQIIIYDTVGNKVIIKETQLQKVNIDISKLDKGLYFIKTDNSTAKFIIE